jgi:hypothetical protein
MRKLLIAVLALTGVIAVAGVAIAANTYDVNVASSKPAGKGSVKRPLPKAVNFGFTVQDTDPTRRATVIETYAIAPEGLVTNPRVFPKCAFTDLDNATVPAKCSKAQVGTGLVKNAAGPTGDQSLAASLPCNLALRVYNTGTGMALRLDSQGAGQPPSFESDTIGCPLPVATAINGRFVKVKVDGVTASEFRFSVPENLKHPLAGIDNSVRETLTRIALRKKTATVGGRTRVVGFYESIGCKGTTRTVRATFTDESGAKFTDTKTGRC